MEQKITSQISLPIPQPLSKIPHLTHHNYSNYLQASLDLHIYPLRSQTLASINSLYLRQNQYNPQIGNQIPYFTTATQDNYYDFDEQTPFHVLTFGRGYSELLEPLQSNALHQNCRGQGERLNNCQPDINKQQGLLNNQAGDPILPDLSGQEFKSHSINSHSDINPSVRTTPDTSPKGLLAKNVTKNIGKLLFKYIWKNRNHLRRILKPDSQLWECFLRMIRGCKKENNVTRQFLISKWQGPGQESKMFRIVAHHFFRKHCLSAVYRSKIRLKRIHFERILKFDQALVDPKSLDYLA